MNKNLLSLIFTAMTFVVVLFGVIIDLIALTKK